jgi:hypothetical protein
LFLVYDTQQFTISFWKLRKRTTAALLFKQQAMYERITQILMNILQVLQSLKKKLNWRPQ